MIPLTTKLPAICSLLQRVLEMEEKAETGPWKTTFMHDSIFGPLFQVMKRDKERHDEWWSINGISGQMSEATAAFIALSRNITKPQATALLLAIEALSLTAWVSFGRRDDSYLGSKAYDALQSIADAFPDAQIYAEIARMKLAADAGEHTP